MWAYGSYDRPVGKSDHTQEGNPGGAARRAGGLPASPSAHEAMRRSGASYASTQLAQGPSLQGHSVRQLPVPRPSPLPTIVEGERYTIAELAHMWKVCKKSENPESIFVMRAIVDIIEQNPRASRSQTHPSIDSLKEILAQKEIILHIEGRHPEPDLDPNVLLGYIVNPVLSAEMNQAIDQASSARQTPPLTSRADSVAQRALSPSRTLSDRSSSIITPSSEPSVPSTPITRPVAGAIPQATIRDRLAHCDRLISGGQLDLAVDEAKKLDRHQQNFFLSKIAIQYIRLGHHGRALDLARSMPADLSRPDEVHHKIEIEVLALIALKDFHAAYQLVRDHGKKLTAEFRNDLCKTIVVAAFVNNDLKSAASALVLIDEPDKSECNDAIKEVRKSKPSTAAQRLERIGKVSGIAEGNPILNEIMQKSVAIDHCAKLIKDGDVRGLENYIKPIKNNPFLLQICRLLIEFGLTKTAKTLMERIPLDTGSDVGNISRAEIAVTLLLRDNKTKEAKQVISQSRVGTVFKDRLYGAVFYIQKALGEDTSDTLSRIQDLSVREKLSPSRVQQASPTSMRTIDPTTKDRKLQEDLLIFIKKNQFTLAIDRIGKAKLNGSLTEAEANKAYFMVGVAALCKNKKAIAQEIVTQKLIVDRTQMSDADKFGKILKDWLDTHKDVITLVMDRDNRFISEFKETLR